MRLCIAGITTLSLLLAAPAIADDNAAWSAMTTIGMNGTWSPSCSAPVSPSNGRLTFYLGADNHILRSYDRGPGVPTLNVAVDSAHLVNSTTVQAHVRNDDPNWKEYNGVAVDVVVEVANSKMRTLQSTGADGTQWIKDGVVVKSGNLAPTLEKCPS